MMMTLKENDILIYCEFKETFGRLTARRFMVTKLFGKRALIKDLEKGVFKTIFSQLSLSTQNEWYVSDKTGTYYIKNERLEKLFKDINKVVDMDIILKIRQGNVELETCSPERTSGKKETIISFLSSELESVKDDLKELRAEKNPNNSVEISVLKGKVSLLRTIINSVKKI